MWAALVLGRGVVLAPPRFSLPIRMQTTDMTRPLLWLAASIGVFVSAGGYALDDAGSSSGGGITAGVVLLVPGIVMVAGAVAVARHRNRC